MWHSIKAEGQNGEEKFAVKCISEGGIHRVWVTNLIHIWVENLISEHIVRRCVRYNPHIEATESRLVSKCLDFKSNASTYSITEGRGRDQITFMMHTVLTKVPFRSVFYMHLESPQKMLQQVISPILYMVDDLQSKQDFLVKQIKKKDAEIKAYRLKQTRIRKEKITRPFSEESFHQRGKKSFKNIASKSIDIFTSTLINTFIEEDKPTMLPISPEPDELEHNLTTEKSEDMCNEPQNAGETAEECLNREDNRVDENAEEMHDEALKMETDFQECNCTQQNSDESRNKYLSEEEEKKAAKRQKLSQKKAVLNL